MKIYILTYSSKAFFSYEKRVSGIDSSCLAQFEALRELGHDVRMYSAFTDLHNHLEGIDFYKDDIPADEVKEFNAKNRAAVLENMITQIAKFTPDIIISNHELNGKIYKAILNLDIPIAYIAHSKPGFFSDLNNANLLHEMTQTGNTLTCVSEYHKLQTIDYYSRKRKQWNFKEIIPDYVLFSQFSRKQDIKSADDIVRHVSAANKDKKTFLIHNMFKDTDIVSEVFTTIGYVGGKNNEYVQENLDAFPDNTFLDVDHSDIMDKISTSTACFVGLASYDTFTITSLEAMSRGVPLMVTCGKAGHPAREMLEKHLSEKYVRYVKTKKDFINAYNDFSIMTLAERKELSESVYKVCSFDTYKKNIQDLVDLTLNKFENRAAQENILGI